MSSQNHQWFPTQENPYFIPIGDNQEVIPPVQPEAWMPTMNAAYDPPYPEYLTAGYDCNTLPTVEQGYDPNRMGGLFDEPMSTQYDPPLGVDLNQHIDFGNYRPPHLRLDIGAVAAATSNIAAMAGLSPITPSTATTIGSTFSPAATTSDTAVMMGPNSFMATTATTISSSFSSVGSPSTAATTGQWHRQIEIPSCEEDLKHDVGSDRIRAAADKRRRKEADHPCHFPTCPATFTARHNLQYHINAHLGLKPYRCEKCEYAAASPATRARHQRTCRNSNPYNYGSQSNNHLVR